MEGRALTKRQKIMAEVSVVVILTLVLFFALEITLRLCGVDPRQDLVNPEGPYVRHSTRVWALRPGYSKKWAGTQVDINDKGLRDEAIEYAKPAGEFRILFLGGSVTFAYSVDVEKGYVSLTENLLQKSWGDERHEKIRTINTGVGGYSTFQQLQYLKEEGVKFAPDVVILDFGLNDVLERYLIVKDYGGTGTFRGGQKTEIDLTETKTFAEKVHKFLVNLPRKTALYSVARYIKVRMVAKKQGQADVKEQVWMAKKLIEGEENPKLKAAWKQTLDELHQFVTVSREAGALPILMVYPYRIQVELGAKTSRPQDILKDFAKQEGIDIIDLMTAYAPHPAADLFIDEDHPTVFGHRVAAAEIGRRLSEILKRLK